MSLDEPVSENATHFKKLSELNESKLMFDDPKELKAAEDIILNSSPYKETILELEEKSICQTTLEDKTPGTMTRWQRLVSLDAIVRQCRSEGVDPIKIKEIIFLDYKDENQETGNDPSRASTTFNENESPSILIFHQQQYRTDYPLLFNAIDSAHEAMHCVQILKGELTEKDLPDIHASYDSVKQLSEKEIGTKIIGPSSFKWMVDYYAKEGVAHPFEVNAVNNSIRTVKTMEYLDLSPLDEGAM